MFKIIVCGMFAMGNFNCISSTQETYFTQQECQDATDQLKSKDDFKKLSVTCVGDDHAVHKSDRSGDKKIRSCLLF